MEILEESMERVHLGKIPIMLKSYFCVLKNDTDKALTDVVRFSSNPPFFLYQVEGRLIVNNLCSKGECQYDQGGYFIINGSEKVLVAQERMASNHIYCFATAKGTWYAEIRSMIEGSTRPTAGLSVKLQKSNRVKCPL